MACRVSNIQHGFRPGRCCESQLLDAVHVWNKSTKDKKTVDVLFLDISKAFGKVPRTFVGEVENGGIQRTAADCSANSLLSLRDVRMVRIYMY